MAPQRIQLMRKKGWTLPPNTVSVSRPGIYGNPFSIAPKQRPGSRVGSSYIAVPTVEDAIECFRIWLNENPAGQEVAKLAKKQLRGKNLACWCKQGHPCHADVLLEIANETQ